jgi:hypothetical protein
VTNKLVRMHKEIKGVLIFTNHIFFVRLRNVKYFRQMFNIWINRKSKISYIYFTVDLTH